MAAQEQVTASARRTARLIGALFAVAAVLQFGWLLDFLAHTGVPPWDAYVSELEADSVRHAWWFRGCFVGADLALVLGCLRVLARSRGHRAGWWHAGWLLLTLFAVAAGVDDLTPMSCAPSVSARCRAMLADAQFTATGAAHAVVSVAGGLLCVGGLTALIVSARRGRHSPLAPGISWLARFGPSLLAVQIGAYLVLGACIAVNAAAGVASRAELVSESCWMALLAGVFLVAPRPKEPPVPTRGALAVPRRVAAAVGSLWQFAPASAGYLVVLLVTTLTLHAANPRLGRLLLISASTNVANMRHDPVQVLVTSAFWVQPSLLGTLSLVGFVLLMPPAERWLGTGRLLAVYAVGHVVTSVMTACVASYGGFGPVPPHDPDVGVSYGLATVLGVLVYRLDNRILRWVCAVVLIGGLASIAVAAGHITGYGHLAALLVGFAAYPLARGAWSRYARAEAPALAEPEHRSVGTRGG